MWQDDLARLKKVYLAYLIGWLGGGALIFLGLSSKDPGGAATLAGAVLLTGALGAYIGCLIFAYRVQKGMRDEKLTTHDPVHIVVAGLIFNPCIVGFWIPLSVMLAARKAQRRLGQAPPSLPPDPRG